MRKRGKSDTKNNTRRGEEKKCETIEFLRCNNSAAPTFSNSTRAEPDFFPYRANSGYLSILQTNLFAAFFAYGGLLVVDCAHFQSVLPSFLRKTAFFRYNSVSLGFFIGSYVALTSGFV